MQAKRSEIIGAILRAAKQPTPQIAPIKEWLGENGQWYRPLARPFNMAQWDCLLLIWKTGGLLYKKNVWLISAQSLKQWMMKEYNPKQIIGLNTQLSDHS